MSDQRRQALRGNDAVSGECPTTWDPTTNDLELVAVNHNNATNAVSVIGDAKYQGILFLNGNFLSSNSGSIFGSVIADSGQMSGDADFATRPLPRLAHQEARRPRRRPHHDHDDMERAQGRLVPVLVALSEGARTSATRLRRRIGHDDGRTRDRDALPRDRGRSTDLSVYTSSLISLRHTSIEGNALTLVDRQLELYNTLPYASILLDAGTIPGGSDAYVTAHTSDPTIPSATGQLTGGSAPSGSCTSPTTPQAGCATQTAHRAGRPQLSSRYLHHLRHPTDRRQPPDQASHRRHTQRQERRRRRDHRPRPKRLRRLQPPASNNRNHLLRGRHTVDLLCATFPPDMAIAPRRVRGSPG